MVCKKCGVEFEKKVGNQEFCSASCRNKYWSNKYYEKNKHTILANNKSPEYRAKENERKRTDKYREYRNRLNKEKRRSDPAYRLFKNMSERLKPYYGRFISKSILESALGFTFEQMWVFLSSKIPKGYSIDDYLSGVLELDHIIPFCWYISFEIGDEEFKKCWDIRNLRFLTKEKNRERGRKRIPLFQEIMTSGLPKEIFPCGMDVLLI